MPLTYDQSSQLMNDAAFRGRVKVAALNYAQNILEQAAAPIASRYRWATSVLESPDMWAQKLQSPTVQDPGIQNAGLTTSTPPTSAADDLTVQGAVQAVADRLM